MFIDAHKSFRLDAIHRLWYYLILDTVEARKGVYQQIALDIFNHPEVSNYEFFACKTLSEQLEREGFLKDVDAALCVHPGSGPDMLTTTSLVCAPIDIEFWGRAAHASGNPEDGINALDALILTYNGIGALRQHLKKDIQIHGIIVNGGDAPNTVPEYAGAKFYLRSRTVPQME